MNITTRFKLLLLGLALTPALMHAAFDVKTMALTAGRHTSRAILGAAMRTGVEFLAQEKLDWHNFYVSREDATVMRRDVIYFAGALSTYLLPAKINKLVKLGDDNREGTIAYAVGYMLFPTLLTKGLDWTGQLREKWAAWRASAADSDSDNDEPVRQEDDEDRPRAPRAYAADGAVRLQARRR